MAGNQGASKPTILRPWEDQPAPTNQRATALSQPPAPVPGQYALPAGYQTPIFPSVYPPGLAVPVVGHSFPAVTGLQAPRDALNTLYDGNQQLATPSQYRLPGVISQPAPLLPPQVPSATTPGPAASAVSRPVEREHAALVRKMFRVLPRRLAPAQAAQLSDVALRYTQDVAMLERERFMVLGREQHPASEVNHYFDSQRINLITTTRDHVRQFCTAAAVSGISTENKENPAVCASSKCKVKGKGESSKNARPKNTDQVVTGLDKTQDDAKARDYTKASSSRASATGYETEIDVGGPADEFGGFGGSFTSGESQFPVATPKCEQMAASSKAVVSGCASRGDPEYDDSEATTTVNPAWMIKPRNQSPDISQTNMPSAEQVTAMPNGNDNPHENCNTLEKENQGQEQENEISETPAPAQRPKKGGKVVPFSRRTHEVLEAWYLRHFHRPYVHGEEAESLAEEAGGITVKQLRKWLSNRRNGDRNTRPGGYKRVPVAAAVHDESGHLQYGVPGFMPPPFFLPPAGSGFGPF